MRTANLTLTPASTDTLRGQEVTTSYTIEGKNNTRGIITPFRASSTDHTLIARVTLTLTLNRVPLEVTQTYQITPGEGATPHGDHAPYVCRTEGNRSKPWGFSQDFSDSARQRAVAVADEAADLLAREGEDLEAASESGLRTARHFVPNVMHDALVKSLHEAEEYLIEALAVQRLKDESIPLGEVTPSREAVRARLMRALEVVLDHTTVDPEAGSGGGVHSLHRDPVGRLSIVAGSSEGAVEVMDGLVGGLLAPLD